MHLQSIHANILYFKWSPPWHSCSGPRSWPAASGAGRQEWFVEGDTSEGARELHLCWNLETLTWQVWKNGWFVMIYEGLWWFMMVYDDLWWFMIFCDDLWLFIINYDDLWWFMMVYDALFIVYDDFWWLWWFRFMMPYVTYDDLWWFMTVYGV